MFGPPRGGSVLSFSSRRCRKFSPVSCLFQRFGPVTSFPGILGESVLERHLQSLSYPHQGSHGATCMASGGCLSGSVTRPSLLSRMRGLIRQLAVEVAKAVCFKALAAANADQDTAILESRNDIGLVFSSGHRGRSMASSLHVPRSSAKYSSHLVARHRGFDELMWSQSRIGRS